MQSRPCPPGKHVSPLPSQPQACPSACPACSHPRAPTVLFLCAHIPFILQSGALTSPPFLGCSESLLALPARLHLLYSPCVSKDTLLATVPAQIPSPGFLSSPPSTSTPCELHLRGHPKGFCWASLLSPCLSLPKLSLWPPATPSNTGQASGLGWGLPDTSVGGAQGSPVPGKAGGATPGCGTLDTLTAALLSPAMGLL